MLVRLDKITKSFPNGKEQVTAVDQLDISIQSGKLIGLLGPSGCGKSTTLFMIAGIHDVTGGTIWFDDRDVTNLPSEKRGVGLVFQNYALYPHLTVWENIAFPLLNSKEMKTRLKKEVEEANVNHNTKLTFNDYVKQRVDEAAMLVDILAYMDRKPAELSGGQQQRVAIARAIVKRPSVLLLDEPLSNLDARLRIQTRDELKRIQRETGITTVFVTHDQEEALNICDEVVILKNGVLQQQGAPQEVYDNPANQFVAEFLGTPQINMIHGDIKDNQLFVGGRPWRKLLTPLNDQKVSIGIRAENVKIINDSHAHASDTLDAKLCASTRLGGAISIDGELLNGQHIKMSYDPDHAIVLGATAKITIRPQTTYIFNEEGEKILQC